MPNISFSLPNNKPALMGILNVTPDSFSDGGLHFDYANAVGKGLQLMEDGADLVDVGGESTRPGAPPVDVDEELRRTIPIVEALARQGVPISIDTMKPDVAMQALDAGAIVVNDVSGLRNPAMRELVQTRKPTVCVMHMQGEPLTMQTNPVYQDVVQEVREYLIDVALSLDLPKEQVWIDPGIGFGKTVQHNLDLIRDLAVFVETGHPVVLGVSRKGFIGTILGDLPVHERLEGTLAIQTIAQLKGVRIIRTHDVKAAAKAVRVVSAIENGF